MAFIGPLEPNSHKLNGQRAVLPAQKFAADSHELLYSTEDYRDEDFGQLSFVDSSPYRMHVSGPLFQLMDSSSPAVADHLLDLPATSNSCDQTPQTVWDNQSSEPNMDFDEAIRLKLQEIEHALLDNVDEVAMELCQDPSSDDDWLKYLSFASSPIETSSESSISFVGSDNKGATRSVQQLLFDCATAISECNTGEAQGIILELRQMVAIQGDPSERLAAYLVEGLAARIASSGQGIYRALRCKEAPSLYQLSAMQVLFEVCPCFRFGFMAANYAILEVIRGERAVHIIDFDINQGAQYMALIQSLSKQTNRPHRLRITGVDDPESVQRVVGGLRIIGLRLEKLAEECSVPFEFHAVGANIEDVMPYMLDCRPGEAVIVNFAFQLHHLPDESVSTVNQRDRLLRMVKGIRPKLVTLVEQDANTNTTPFLPRFQEVYSYYSALFDSLDATMQRESLDRMNVERQCLAREIVNILACEGTDRVERYEVAGKWHARMEMAGFAPCRFSDTVVEAVRSLLKSYCDTYRFEEDVGGFLFGWGDRTLVSSSAWR